MSQLILNSRIEIRPNRQRKVFEPADLVELANSIEKLGLLHAPVLRPGSMADTYLLVAGERRIRAMEQIWEMGGTFTYNGKLVPKGYIPYNMLSELSELEAEEAELDENIKRKDLTWQEYSEAVQRLTHLRTKQAEAIGAPVPTVADIAVELRGSSEGGNQDIVRKALIVAEHLDNPLIAAAKNTNEAFKILKAEETKEANIKLAAVVGSSCQADLHTVVNDNCMHWMALQPDEQFDVILVDPPYGMNADKFSDAAGKMTAISHDYDDSYEAWKKLLPGWCQEAFRLAKPQAHAYVFCDFDRFHELKTFMESAGWYVFRTPIISYKLNSGRVPLPEHGPRRQYELCLYAIKGKKPVTHIYPDIIPNQGDDNTGHGAQKAVALLQNLLQRSVRPGDKILDTFGGSGGTLAAAHMLKCYATIIEADPASYGLCIQRLQGLKDSENLLGA